MASVNTHDLLKQLLASRRPEDVAGILATLGDSADLDLGEPIGDSGLVWLPVGGDAGNLSAINLATKPGRSITERVTNAFDAMLELRAHRSNGDLPRSPAGSAELWFGRPASGPDSGLYSWDYGASHADELIHVSVLESGQEEAPTIDVLDAGIGLRPDDMPGTILSLRSGNKIRKFYLIGAFGQGGSSALGFSEYVIYASRHADSPERVGFTVVRVRRLGDAYKEDCYAYLAVPLGGESPSVPWADVGRDVIDLYATPAVSAPLWTHGTLTRHIGFKLPGQAGTLQSVPGNLYHYLHASLFDPLLPFRLLDLRTPGKEKNELISGSRNRLMRYVARKGAEAEGEGRGELRHYRPMEFVVPHGEVIPSIGIEYWVLLNWRKGKGGKGADRILRPSSNELFVSRNHPVVGTLNGQNQGELTALLFKKLNLGMTGKHIVVHVDATRTPSHIRRELFSSTREGFRDGPVLSAIEQVLTSMLSEDDELAKIERELAERIVEKETEATEDEVRRVITKLLLDSGAVVADPGATVMPGAGETEEAGRKKRRRYLHKEPLPTLPFPQVTRWEMVVPQEELGIRLGDYETVLVETDASAEFDRKGLIGIRAEPPVLEVGSKAPLSGGRVRWRMRTTEAAKEGDSGVLIASLTRPDGSQLSATKPFKVLARRPEPTTQTRGKIPPFDVWPINPLDESHRETWGQLWPDLAETEDQEQLESVAYKTTQLGTKRVVYFNVLFPPFRRQEDAYLLESKALAEMFRLQYKIWIGYHALLQDIDAADERAAAVDELELVERTLHEETIRVATMQAKQARQFVEVKRLALQPADTSSE